MSETGTKAKYQNRIRRIYNETYKEFVDKFKPKKTTDDCYTPPLVYEAVKAWAICEFGWQGRVIARPFYPGGDYERFEYPENCAVIDNPPFSIISKIAAFYEERGISYMLFAPYLTCLDIRAARSHIITPCDIIYENGAKVKTSFIASEGARVRTAPELYKRVTAAVEAGKGNKALPKYEYPPEVLTSSRLGKWCELGIEFKDDNCVFTRKLDAQRAAGKEIFGAGYLSAKAADPSLVTAAKMAAAYIAEEREVTSWELSQRERDLIYGEN